MRDKDLVWDAMIERYGLQSNALNSLANWSFGDFIFEVEVDAFFDVSKARRFGFHEMNLDSGAEVVKLIEQLRAQKIIPSRT